MKYISFIFIALAAYLGPAFYAASVLNSSFLELTATIVHAFIAIGLTVYFLYITRTSPRSIAIRPIYIMVFTTICYFDASYLKYLSVPLYAPFETEAIPRLFGTTLVAVSILGMLLLLHYFSRKGKWAREGDFLLRDLLAPRNISLGFWLIAPLAVLYSLFMLFTGGFGEDITTVSYDKIILGSLGKVAIFAVTFLVFASLCQAYLSKLRSLSPTTFAAIGMSGLLIATAFSVGARHILVFQVIMLIIALLCFSQRRGIFAMQALLILLPAAGVFIAGPLTIAIKGEAASWMFQDLANVITAFTYRCDLSDFAISLATDSHGQYGGPGVISDGLFNMIPRAVFPAKYSLITGAWNNQFHAIGWLPPTIKDYPDTLFSIGGGVAGIPGMIVFPWIFMLVVAGAEKLLLWIANATSVLPIAVIVFSAGFLRIESDPLYYFGYCRDVVLLTIIIGTASLLIRRRRMTPQKAIMSPAKGVTLAPKR